MAAAVPAHDPPAPAGASCAGPRTARLGWCTAQWLRKQETQESQDAQNYAREQQMSESQRDSQRESAKPTPSGSCCSGASGSRSPPGGWPPRSPCIMSGAMAGASNEAACGWGASNRVGRRSHEDP